MRHRVLTALLGATLASCGGGDGEETTTTTTTTTDTGGGETTTTTDEHERPAAPATWAEATTHELKAAYMRERVVPEMEALFQEFDPEEFARFRCNNCHGDNAAEVDFQMPNTLHPLNPDELGAMFHSTDPEVSRWMDFMLHQVRPRMAALLGEPEFNPETGEGFKCFDCHATEGEPPPQPTPQE